MTGEEILNEVRFLSGQHNWARYTEINRAFRRICQVTRFNFLRESRENLIPFKSGVNEYTYDLSQWRAIERLWVYGVQSGQIYWHLMEEAPPQLFEDLVFNYRMPDGSNKETRPGYYKIEGNTLTVTPTPDQNYSTKIDYIPHIPEIQRDTEPVIPSAFHDALCSLAAAYVLEQEGGDELGLLKAQRLEARAFNDVGILVRDTHLNRTADIDRPAQEWLS